MRTVPQLLILSLKSMENRIQNLYIVQETDLFTECKRELCKDEQYVYISWLIKIFKAKMYRFILTFHEIIWATKFTGNFFNSKKCSLSIKKKLRRWENLPVFPLDLSKQNHSKAFKDAQGTIVKINYILKGESGQFSEIAGRTKQSFSWRFSLQ